MPGLEDMRSPSLSYSTSRTCLQAFAVPDVAPDVTPEMAKVGLAWCPPPGLSMLSPVSSVLYLLFNYFGLQRVTAAVASDTCGSEQALHI